MMLASYQRVVSSLLRQNHCPGLSADELELFKIHFGSAAFTCRLSSCPRTTLGFETERLRSEHEMSHIRCFRCTFPGCQYPPFVSARALKNHTSKYHTPITDRKAIRKVASQQPSQRIQMGIHTHRNRPQLQQPAARDAQTVPLSTSSPNPVRGQDMNQSTVSSDSHPFRQGTQGPDGIALNDVNNSTGKVDSRGEIKPSPSEQAHKQLRLMPLKQQNRGTVMEARQEQDTIASSSGQRSPRQNDQSMPKASLQLMQGVAPPEDADPFEFDFGWLDEENNELFVVDPKHDHPMEDSDYAHFFNEENNESLMLFDPPHMLFDPHLY